VKSSRFLKSSPFWDDLDFLTNKNSFLVETPPASLVVGTSSEETTYAGGSQKRLSASYKIGQNSEVPASWWFQPL